MKRVLILIPSGMATTLLVAQPRADGIQGNPLNGKALSAAASWGPVPASVTLGILLMLIAWLLLFRRFVAAPRVIRFLSLGALLLVVELLRLVSVTAVERLSAWSPLLLVPVVILIASLLIAFHFRLEKWAVKKLEQKNKQLRLADARRIVNKT
ncbi:MAG: hypothetical protein EOO09_10205 [Chitinophagaceae bacterium]|nr:MAG: hypothetical protein EOO09_10205 [Chitinophagaceae bacterium]